MLHVILDANAVGVDPPLGKLEHRVLLDAHRSGTIVLVVPQLALREAVNTWKSKVQLQSQKLANCEDELRKLIPSRARRVESINLEDAARTLLDDLAALLAAAGVDTPGTPDARHEELIERRSSGVSHSTQPVAATATPCSGRSFETAPRC